MNHDILDVEALHIPYMETTTFGDYTIKIEHDDTGESPREWDNMTRMVCWHNNYNLGDEHGYESPTVFMHVVSGLYPDLATEDLTEKQYDRCVAMATKRNVILPLYLYDHSGITMSTAPSSCHWDSGRVGYIFMSHEDIRKEYDVKRVSQKMRDRIQVYLEADVKIYDDFLTGNVYWFNVEKTDNDETVDVDSCGGFYGYEDPYMIECIKDAIRFDIRYTPQQTEMF